jgi:CubicO group peptidase (beta-lactamase class C family)
MVGSPPPADKLVRFEDGSWFVFPRTRWSFSHVRQLLPTVVVGRGPGPVSALRRAERSDLDAVTFQPIGRTDTVTWAESLDANYTDGIVVLHRGNIVYERYFGVLTPETPHLAFSVTKSYVATLAMMLMGEGAIGADAPVVKYLPEFSHSAFADATIRQLLDMRTGLDYTEDYTERDSPVWRMSRAGGFLARPPGYDGPESFFDFLKGMKKLGQHGGDFVYKTANTDALGAVLRRVTGRSVSALLQERIFAKLGPEQDAFFTVDPTGAEFAGAGLNLTLRDMARFGEAMRLDGKFNGQQIVPKTVIDDIRTGGDRARFVSAGYQTLPGWSYRNMWWVSHNEHGAYMARGVHGQAIYVDPTAEMVIARFASHPLAGNVNLDPMSLPGYHAVALHLMKAR